MTEKAATRCAVCPLLLSDYEVSIVENAIGKQAVWMFNKVWEERKNVVKWLETAKKTTDMCKQQKRVELKYWEFKEEEMKAVIKLETEILDSVIQSLKGKIKPRLFNKVATYVQQAKDGLPQ
jgi:hypothetical protein